MAGDTAVYLLDGTDDYKIAKREQFNDPDAASPSGGSAVSRRRAIRSATAGALGALTGVTASLARHCAPTSRDSLSHAPMFVQ